MKYKPTYQQEEIINSDANSLIVSAFAGAAKTTTLVMYAEARRYQRMLYIAFNKSVQVEALSKFPPNVKVVTAHALAFRAVGHLYADKLVAGLRPFMIMQHGNLKNNLPDMDNNMHALFATRVIEAINRYISSTDTEIDRSHFNLTGKEWKDFPIKYAMQLSNDLWARMCDVNDSDVKMTHDGYLKLYMETGQSFGNYDAILLDEAQDSNPVTISMFERQQGRKVMVGDQHQAIYQFRGAVNAMNDFHAEKQFNLTQSFRFGQNIADLANHILHINEEPEYLWGQSSIKDKLILTENEIKRAPEPYAFLSRGNSGLFMEAVAAIKANKKIHFLGGVAAYNLDIVLDAYNLKNGAGALVKDPFMKSFKNFEDFTEYANESTDNEALRLVSCANRMKQDIPFLLSKVKESQTVDRADAGVILTTAHKSKGLEFDRVVVSGCSPFRDEYDEDDKKTKDKDKKPKEITIGDIEDINLAYVAATRAVHALHVPFLEDILKKIGPEVRAKKVRAIEARHAAENPIEVAPEAEKTITITGAGLRKGRRGMRAG